MTFRVTLMPSGRSFDVSGQTNILQAGLASGISMPYGCRLGTCRTCRGKILSGRIDFGNAHPTYLTQEHRAQGYALLCQATAASDVVIEVEELPRLVPAEKFQAMVRKINKVAPDVAIVDFRLPLHLNLRFAAGQYVDVLLAEGRRRSYSIANAPKTEGVIDLQFHMRLMPGGVFTEHVFGQMKEREKINCEGPLGTFFLRDESEKDIVLVASGTGYAPIRSLLLDAFQRKITRPMTLYWGARTKRDLYMPSEPEQWAKEYANFRFVPVLSEAALEDGWSGRVGLVHRAVIEDFPDLSGHQVYACGVPVMVDAARNDFAARCGLPPNEFQADSFVSQADVHVAADLGVRTSR